MEKTRQKNCNSCVQNKRRCDRRKPECSRCAEKQMPCIYSLSRPKAAPSTTGTSPPASTDAGGLLFASLGSAYSLFTPSLDLDLDYTPQSDTNTRDDISMSAFMDFTGNTAPPSPSQWLVPAEEQASIFAEPERPRTPADQQVQRTYHTIAFSSFCHGADPWLVYDPTSLLHYITNRVKSFPTDLATTNATPFLHRFLYRAYTPRCIVTCFAASVLYANRTPQNTSMVMRALHGSVGELVEAESGRSAATPVEKLARAQALFVYQVIRLFDGDVGLRAQGEKDIALLKTWLDELCKIRENLGDLAQLEDCAARRQQPPKEWERWIFAESLRRTIVMAYSVISLFSLMKDPEHEEPGPWAFTHRWTLARSLWEAGSSFEFHRMWKEKPQFIIANYSFETFLEHGGRGEDVDDFAEILLSSYMGVDPAKEFIHKNIGASQKMVAS
ncbi:hypothetical protein B0T25DRAFT_560951 [Lasiosphaeria hispida]|uniref:Zn(2)-C6 fungal-type domain-containing protein n=1 Tax=Lasiosphaeria hispida TaxID=260671 RepID=A0AAJ0H621_9PEZI|nr:hypothetical protein B0T25DRAFT_560951 [Lasiosphaeria hispida]